LCRDETRTSEHIGISPAEEGWTVANDNERYLVAALTCNVLQHIQPSQVHPDLVGFPYLKNCSVRSQGSCCLCTNGSQNHLVLHKFMRFKKFYYTGAICEQSGMS
jgi:hypothetical protein